MSVKLIFCSSSGCFQKDVTFVDYVFRLPVKYEELKNVRYTDGFVIYDENVIVDFWHVFAESSFIPYKCERLEICFSDCEEFQGTWNCKGFGYE